MATLTIDTVMNALCELGKKIGGIDRAVFGQGRELAALYSRVQKLEVEFHELAALYSRLRKLEMEFHTERDRREGIRAYDVYARHNRDEALGQCPTCHAKLLYEPHATGCSFFGRATSEEIAAQSDGLRKLTPHSERLYTGKFRQEMVKRLEDHIANNTPPLHRESQEYGKLIERIEGKLQRQAEMTSAERAKRIEDIRTQPPSWASMSSKAIVTSVDEIWPNLPDSLLDHEDHYVASWWNSENRKNEFFTEDATLREVLARLRTEVQIRLDAKVNISHLHVHRGPVDKDSQIFAEMDDEVA